VQVIRGRPLEEFAARLPENEIVVRRETNVALVADVPDPGVLLQVAAADAGGAIGRGVVRDNQLEVLVALTEQGFDGLGEVVLAVVDGKPDAQPGCSGHRAPPGDPAWRGLRATTAPVIRLRSPATRILIASFLYVR